MLSTICFVTILIPIVIIECGFLSNPEELKLLQSSSYQKKAAQCIYQGLKNYLDGRN